jgi:hypothetical protein
MRESERPAFFNTLGQKQLRKIAPRKKQKARRKIRRALLHQSSLAMAVTTTSTV